MPLPEAVPPHVAIRVDGSGRIGGGHVMRCLSLAGALAGRGGRVTFACALLPDALARRIAAAGHELVRVEPVPALLDESPGWDGEVLAGDAQRLDAQRTQAATGAADWMVVDHYRLDGQWLSAVNPGARRLVIDDLANRPQPCDILVDQTFGRVAADYQPWVPAGCRILAGARYAMLRPEFAAARPRALARRRRQDEVGRLLISLGTTDIGGITIRALESILAAGVECAIDVVLGAEAASLDSVRAIAARDARVTLHVDRQDMAALIVEADLAVGAPGTSSWERCCLGLPAVTIILADNQRLVSDMLAQAGAVVPAADAADIGPAVRALLDDDRARAIMTAAASAIVDGKGADLVAEAMFGGAAPTAPSPSVRLRPAGPEDAERLWLWRNDPLTRAMAKNDAPIAWANHQNWFTRVLASGDSRLFMADADGQSVAMVRFDRALADAVVSINVNPAARGGGFGKAALAAACDIYEREASPDRLVAEIRSDNGASRRIFEAAGFERQPEAAGQFLRLVRAGRDQQLNGRP